MAWVPCQSKTATAALCQNSPITPLVSQRKVLWPLLSLWPLCLPLLLAHALHNSLTAFLVALAQTRHVIATGSLQRLLLWPETLFLRCPHSSLSPFLQVSDQVAADQCISEALLITHINMSPALSLHIPSALLYFSCITYHHRTCYIFTDLFSVFSL